MTAVAPARPSLPSRVGAAVAGAADSGLAIWLVVAAVGALSATQSPLFLTNRNIANLLAQFVALGLAAVGQTFAVLAGAIDLSVGSTAKLSAVVSAGLIDGRPGPVLPVVALVLAMGAGIGLVNGLLITRLRVPAFIVTLGTFSALQGLAFAYTTAPVGGMPAVVTRLVYATVGPLPLPFLLFAALAGLSAWVLRRTVFGRRVYAVGGDVEIARIAGIPTDRVTVLVMVASATFAALAGLVLASRAGVGTPSAGDGLELASITAVVLGGTSLFGGRGRIIGTVGGAVLLALIDNSLNLLRVSSFYQDLVRGVVILVAVAVFIRKD